MNLNLKKGELENKLEKMFIDVLNNNPVVYIYYNLNDAILKS
ncbi:hypothetical protein RU87_GL001740 [Lactococcus plantarum]|uniref:Uncharacterized protein n=1 Tax=Pseudolactococcus plantarum TaxID=1365 RepID=A0A2A5RYA1_9LACT|nr:hypothetical protein RU87_GL001740 [Lactococcus plantarum]